MRVILSTALIALAIVGVGVGAYLLGDRNSTDATSDVASETVLIELPVTPLATSYGIEPSPAPAPIEKAIAVNVSFAVTDELAAFGALGTVLLGPKAWTGSAGMGANGNISFTLSPSGTTSEGGERIGVFMASPGTGNAIDAAAPFNASIRDRWEETGKTLPAPTEIPGVTFKTGHWVMYESAANGGLELHGAAYSYVRDDGYGWFDQIEVILPASKRLLAETVVKYFVEHIRLP